MLSLNNLPPPPSLNTITACENEGQLRSYSLSKAYEAVVTMLGLSNIEVVVNQETIRPAQSKYEAKQAFSSYTETIGQRLTWAYYEDGILAVIHRICDEERNISPGIRKLAKLFLTFIDKLDMLKSYLPFQQKRHIISSLTFDSSLHFVNEFIVNVAWHPHCTTLAAVFADDTIRIYGRGRSLVPLLKHRLQRGIVHVEWMKYSTSILGVACSSGILLWSLDPISVVTRPSASCLMNLVHPGTVPSSSFSWHPKGLTLACVGGHGRELVVWDVGKEDSVSVYWGLFSSFNFLLWSPDGFRLLASMSSASIKVFECRSWSFEQWSLEYPLQSAVWSHCGQHLLFATEQDPFLYSLSFYNGDAGIGGSNVAIRMIDFTPIIVACEDGQEARVGGPVKELAWDDASERLAVIFQDCELIALFRSRVRRQLHFAPGGFIRGEAGRIPLHISFHKSDINLSVLSVVWSGGVVRHIPLCYTPTEPSFRKFNDSIFIGNPSDQSRFASHTLNQSGFTSHMLNQSPLAFASSSTPTIQKRMQNVGPGFTSPVPSPISRIFMSPS